MYLLLINPTSGGGRGRVHGERVIRYLQSQEIPVADISGSSYESAAASLHAALKNEDVAGVIIVGGDGFVHLAIQELALTQVPLILIPAGTGNDFARTMNLPLDDPEEILRRCLNSPAERIDLGIVNGRYFAEVLSTGFDSVVNERANRMRRIKGPAKYNLAILLELPLFKAIDYQMKIDGELSNKQGMLIAIGNGISYGGGMKVCPNAAIDDGLFDVMILEPVSKIEFLRVFPKVFTGAHINHPKVSVRRAKRIEISAAAVAYADGERIGELPITAEVVSNALLTWRFA